MKTLAFFFAVTALGVAAATVAANAGEQTVTRTGPNGGTMAATRTCSDGGASCQRSMQATGAYGRTVSGSASVTRQSGQSVATGSVVGPGGGVYNRTVTRSW
ncbi:MAG: hypothetical protein Kow0026_10600 [Oricola sp.]